MKTALRLGLVACITVAVMAFAGATPALAHEEREVGQFHLAVGFGEEPAYAGQENSVQLILNDAQENPVTDLGDTLMVEVGYQDQTLPAMTMEPNFEVGEFGTPGDYRAFFFPTRPGSYSFHFTGSIKGQQIDETWTSGPQTFSDVQDSSGVEFPVKDPTTGELATRLDREVQRVTTSAQAEVAAAKDQADSAHTLALIGIIVGGVGLVVGVIGLVLATRRRT
jgi:hypothetical protein